MGFNDLKIGLRLYIAFGVILVLLLSLGFIAIFIFQGVGDVFDDFKATTNPNTLYALEMRTAVFEVQQWITDVSATKDKAGFEDAKQWYDVYHENSKNLMKNFEKHSETENIKLLQETDKSFEELYQLGIKMANTYIDEGTEAGNVIMEEFDTSSNNLGEHIGKLKDNQLLEMKNSFAEINKQKNRFVSIVTTVIIIAVLLGVGIAIVLTRMITTPINTISKQVKTLAETGDLSIRVTVMGKDEIGEMATALNNMLDNTAGPIKELSDIAETIAGGDLTKSVNVQAKGDIVKLIGAFKTMVTSLQNLIGNIKKNAVQSAASAEELSASAEEVNASMEQVSSTIQEVAKGAQSTSKGATDAQSASKKTGDSASAGSKAAASVKDKMNTISATTEEGAQKIKGLGNKSKEIGKIVDTINNISEQTNLLALNAAIEAARAGEAGRGFAVVADEVRKLAEESGKATGQISDLIAGIQSEIQGSVDSMERNTKQVAEGSAAVQQALASFETIPTLVEGVNRTLADMAAVAEENAAGSEEVSSSVQQVASAMQQVSSSAQQLSAGAEQLKSLVAKFKINEDREATDTGDQKKHDEELKQLRESHEKALKKTARL